MRIESNVASPEQNFNCLPGKECYTDNMNQPIPTVLVFSGLDPGGGAGIQADIEALSSQGCHACPIITALTVQDTRDVSRVSSVTPELVLEQAETLLADINIDAIKIGLVNSIEMVEVIQTILNKLTHVPVVFDPVLASGNETDLNNNETRHAFNKYILPHTTVLTPNSKEARLLAPETDTLDACAVALLDKGCEYVLITGAHEPSEKVCNTLYNNHRKPETFQWPRLEGEFHGSGCTLAASIAGLLAHGNDPMSAVHEAQEYTWQSLKQSYMIGRGQSIPNRFFWAKNK